MMPDAGQPQGVTPTPKQVVFLFMAGTVTAVVAFLFGVLVGRGSPPAPAPPVDGDRERTRDHRPALAGDDPFEDAQAGLAGEGLSYPFRLGLDGETGDESLREPARPGPENPVAARRPPEPAAAPAAAMTVQVGALADRDLAQRIADRLVHRGYPAFVADPPHDADVPLYRVRVGRYAEHRVAERMKQRLEIEERFRPWITR